MSESFSLRIPESVTIPEGMKPVPVIAKTLLPTFHPEDPKNPIRVFDEKELELAARSLFGRTIDINHRNVVSKALVLNAGWNVTNKCVEAILGVPQKIYDLIYTKHEISEVSVDYIWDTIVKKGKQSIFKGLKFIGIALAHGIRGADRGAKILAQNALFEAQSGSFTMEILSETDPASLYTEDAKELIAYLGEPFAGYKDFADCVAQNQDKKDPKAYCGFIKHKTEATIKANVEIIKEKLGEIQRGRERDKEA